MRFFLSNRRKQFGNQKFQKLFPFDIYIFVAGIKKYFHVCECRRQNKSASNHFILISTTDKGILYSIQSWPDYQLADENSGREI